MRAASISMSIGAALVAAACTDTSVRGCPLHPNSNSNPYGLAYNVTQGGDCPIPLAYIGERKSVGGVVTGDAGKNLNSEWIIVKNYDDFEVGTNYDLFRWTFPELVDT